MMVVGLAYLQGICKLNYLIPSCTTFQYKAAMGRKIACLSPFGLMEALAALLKLDFCIKLVPMFCLKPLPIHKEHYLHKINFRGTKYRTYYSLIAHQELDITLPPIAHTFIMIRPQLTTLSMRLSTFSTLNSRPTKTKRYFQQARDMQASTFPTWCSGFQPSTAWLILR